MKKSSVSIELFIITYGACDSYLCIQMIRASELSCITYSFCPSDCVSLKKYFSIFHSSVGCLGLSWTIVFLTPWEFLCLWWDSSGRWHVQGDITPVAEVWEEVAGFALGLSSWHLGKVELIWSAGKAGYHSFSLSVTHFLSVSVSLPSLVPSPLPLQVGPLWRTFTMPTNSQSSPRCPALSVHGFLNFHRTTLLQPSAIPTSVTLSFKLFPGSCFLLHPIPPEYMLVFLSKGIGS